MLFMLYYILFVLAYKQTYGNEPIWKYYKRNFKGHIPPIKTRKTCIVCILKKNLKYYLIYNSMNILKFFFIIL